MTRWQLHREDVISLPQVGLPPEIRGEAHAITVRERATLAPPTQSHTLYCKYMKERPGLVVTRVKSVLTL